MSRLIDADTVKQVPVRQAATRHKATQKSNYQK